MRSNPATCRKHGKNSAGLNQSPHLKHRFMKHIHNHPAETYRSELATVRWGNILYVIENHFKDNGLYNGMSILLEIECI